MKMTEHPLAKRVRQVCEAAHDKKGMAEWCNRCVHAVKTRLSGQMQDAILHDAAKEILLRKFDFPEDIMLAEEVEQEIIQHYEWEKSNEQH